MRILHISEKHTAAAGGTTKAVHDLAAALMARGHAGSIIGSGAAPLPAPAGVRLHTTAAEHSLLGKLWHYSPAFPELLEGEIEAFRPDIIHLHGFWMGPQFVAAGIARRHGIPTVLSVHGSMFYRRWQKAFRLSHLKKGLYAHMLAIPRFARVSMVHAITGQERELLEGLFPNRPMVTIPNSIAPGPNPGTAPRAEKHFAFIGRISPEKNLENLILAFLQSGLGADWRLSIVGPVGDQAYFGRLQAAAAPGGNRVIFTGPVYGADKDKLVGSLQAAVIPSFTEVISLVNLECAAACVPTITTRETGLTEWEDHGGLLSGCDADALARALEKAASWDDAERAQRGCMLRRHIERTYSSEVVTDRWEEVYSGLLSDT